MTTLKQRILTAAASLTLLGGIVGCETHAGTGAIIGGAAGAGLGAIIGNNTGHGHTAGGAAIGGAAGAIGGALIGNEMDKSDHRHADRYDRDRYYGHDRDYPPRYDDRDRYYDRY